MTSRFTIRRLIAIVTLLIIGCGIFFFAYDSMREGNDLARLDMPVLQWVIAHRSPDMTAFMQLVTNIVAPVPFALVIVLGTVAWAIWKKELWRPSLLVGAMGLTLGISSLIKNLIERSRPPHIDMVLPLELDYSFPSGHTLGIAVYLLVLGYLLYSRRRSPRFLAAWIPASVFAIGLVAFSRLYLGYHWITDVTASVGLSLVILAVIVLVDTCKPSKVF